MKKRIRTILVIVILLAAAGFGISRLDITPAKHTPAERGEQSVSLSAGEVREPEEQTAPVRPSEASAAPGQRPTQEPSAAPQTSAGPERSPEPETPAAADASQTPEAPAESEQPQEPERPAGSGQSAGTDQPAEPEASPEPEPTPAPEQPSPPEETPVPEPSSAQETPAEPEPSAAPETPTVPEEPPAPELTPEPEAGEPEPERHVCTIEISCWTVAEDLSKLENEAVLSYIPADGWILPRTEVEFTPGETVADILDRTCWEYDIQIEHRSTAAYGGMYVLGMGFLYAMDAGSESGWMYHVNGQFPNYGCSRFTVQDGDAIAWVYTCDLGRDVGDNSVW